MIPERRWTPRRTLTGNDPIGMVYSIGFRKGGRGGYGLVITGNGIVIGRTTFRSVETTYGMAPERKQVEDYAIYLGRDSEADQSDRIEARGYAQKIERSKVFEASREEIRDIRIKQPGVFSSGLFTVSASGGEFSLKMKVLPDTLGVLLVSIEEFKQFGPLGGE